MDKKRLLYLGLFIVACIGLGYLLYRVFFAPKVTVAPPPSAPGSQTSPSPAQFPEAGQGRPQGNGGGQGSLPTAGRTTTGQTTSGAPSIIQTVINDSVVGAKVDKKGNVNYYNQIDGKFYRLGRDGKPELLSSNVFYNVQKVTWSPTKSASILEYPDGSKIFYDFEAQRQATLPKYWQDFSFAGQGDKIAAKSLGYSPENRWLVTANPDGSGANLVAALGDNADKVHVDWSPNNQIVATSLTGESLGGDRQEVLFLGLHGENFKSTIVEGRDLRSLWAPDGKKMLYSVYTAQNDFKPELWIVNSDGDAIGSGRKLLNVQTWADKCNFSDPKTVYCGVPEKLDTGVGFAPTLADGTRDNLVKIDVQTGAQTILPVPDFHVIDHIDVSADGKELYFTDKQATGVFNVHL